jgi:hypothetical protein
VNLVNFVNFVTVLDRPECQCAGQAREDENPTPSTGDEGREALPASAVTGGIRGREGRSYSVSARARLQPSEWSGGILLHLGIILMYMPLPLGAIHAA